MAGWQYRVVRAVSGGAVLYDLLEVYLGETGHPVAFGPVRLEHYASIEELRDLVAHLAAALRDPVLDLGDVVIRAAETPWES